MFVAKMNTMPEPLKNIFALPLVTRFAEEVKSVYPSIDVAQFVPQVIDATWESLELKQRMRQISLVVRRFLPEDLPAAIQIMSEVAAQHIARRGGQLSFEYMFIPDFLEAHGLEAPDAAIQAMEQITQLSSAEFAVRPFLLHFPEKMYPQMLEWSKHASPYVRRLSSEGFRPRLPWGMGVPALKRDPSPILPVLEQLKQDPAETVRRSVANNLNDIAKDHPALVLDILQRWQGLGPETDWILRHASRGLLKKGHSEVLAHFGFEQGVAHVEIKDLNFTPVVKIGETFQFDFKVHNASAAPINIRLEYAIDYLTGSGNISHKVFKIKEMRLGGGQTEHLARKQRFTDFTTRKHYPGTHKLEILVNGKGLVAGHFQVD
jgi:3-methyladenine DNA glycosylase AlkC